MIPFLTEVLEFSAAAILLAGAIPIFNKSRSIPSTCISVRRVSK
jgi:hypothetical protein